MNSEEVIKKGPLSEPRRFECSRSGSAAAVVAAAVVAAVVVAAVVVAAAVAAAEAAAAEHEQNDENDDDPETAVISAHIYESLSPHKKCLPRCIRGAA